MIRGLRSKAGWFVQRHPLGLALALGLLLRLIAIESRSLQYDDVFSIFLASRSLLEILSGTAADTMPPLYYFLLHFWMLLGQSAWFVRLLSVLLSLAAVFVLYQLVLCWMGRSAAGWAALLAAVSPLMIYHGQDVRMYALLVTCQLGYLWFFSRIWLAADGQKSRLADWAGLVLCGAAAMYTHNVAVFALAVPNLFLLVKRQWKLLARLLVAQMVTGVLALPWLLLIPGQISKVQKAWTLPRPSMLEIIQALIMFTASLPLPFPLLAIALLITLQILVMLGLELWRSRVGQPGFAFWLALLLLPPGLLLVASFMMQPIFIPRAFLISSLAYDALAAFVIVKAWRRGAGKLLAALFVLAAALTLPAYYTYDEFPRSPYRQAVTYLEKVVQPGEQVVHETKLSYFSSRFYAPDLRQVFVADPSGTPNDTFEPASQRAMQIFPEPNLETAVGDSPGIYFVTFTQTFTEYQALGFAEHPGLAWLDVHLRRVDHQAFGDLEIYYYVQ